MCGVILCMTENSRGKNGDKNKIVFIKVSVINLVPVIAVIMTKI